MGRATILENKREGKYRCLYHFGTEVIARELLIIGQKIDEYNKAIVDLTDEITTLTTEFTAANVALQSVLAETGPMTEDRKKRLSAALAYLNKVGIDLKQAEASKELSKVRKEAIVARSFLLSALPESEERELWMADYSAEIEPTGAEIPTIEVAGEARGENWALLYPANNKAPLAFDVVMHGERTHALGMSPSACFAAWSMFPGWQKYRPSYRVGKILEMRDDNLAKVQLQVPLISSEQNLPIPPSDPMAVDAIFERQTHERVPFEYMECGAIAFKVGDEVLIKYKQQDSLQPVIIGFAHDPEPCSAINVYTSNKERLRYAPRGGKEGKGAWASVKNETVPRFGSCYWVGESGAVSWHGWRARYFAARISPAHAQFLDPDEHFTAPSIYHRGLNYGPCPGIVLGGCVRKGFLFVVCRIGAAEALCWCPLVGKKEWTEIARVKADKWSVLSPWYFSASGLKAASAKSISATGGFESFPGNNEQTQLVELARTGDAPRPPFAATFQVHAPVPLTEVQLGVVPGADVTFGSVALTERAFAVDYVGESLVTLDRRQESRSFFKYPDKGTQERRTFILCPALNLELEDFHVITTGSPIRQTQTMQTPAQIDHLNITGGLGKVVAVTRRVDGTSLLTSPGDGTGTITVTATQTMRLRSGTDTQSLEPVTRAASWMYSPSGTVASDIFYLTSSLFNLFGSYEPMSYTVATRTGHLVTSMPLVGLGRAMPPLPVGSPLRLVGGGPIGAG